MRGVCVGTCMGCVLVKVIQSLFSTAKSKIIALVVYLCVAHLYVGCVWIMCVLFST